MMQHRLLPPRTRGREVVELNVTAFMNLMVVLVPFLLIIAVFSRITIHEMNLPAPGGDQSQSEEQAPLQLEVIVRADGISVGDRRRGVLSRFPRRNGSQDLAALSDWLQKLKARFPDELGATILLEPKINYDELIQVMDTVRVYRAPGEAVGARAELFPLISLGDAPKAVGG